MPEFIYCWRVLTVILFVLTCVHIHSLSREVFHRSVIAPGKKFIASLEIDLCYKIDRENDYCKSLEASDAKSTGGFKLKTASEIIGEFKRCNISQWSTATSKTENVTYVETEHLLSDGYICVRRKFAIDNNRENTVYLIQSHRNKKFSAHITYSRNYESDGEYRTKKVFLFTRECWKEQGEVSKCTDTNRQYIFGINYFTNKFLEQPFTSDCVYRKNGNQSATQNDCFEDCIKEKKKFHLLTYRERDNFTLDYSDASSLEDLSDDCSVSCQQEDCHIIGLYVSVSAISQNYPGGSFAIDLANKEMIIETIPLFNTADILWMFSTLVTVFFGLNLYDLSRKPANLYPCPTGRGRNRKKRKRNKKQAAFAFVIIILGLSLVIEKVGFDFGREEDRVQTTKEPISDRNVSVSICFDLCKILINDGLKYANNCNDGLLYNSSIKELNEVTWDVQEFKSKSSMRNSARPYPIRQNEFKIPMFFRDLKKCFLLHYESANHWPHLPMQKLSKVHINISADYAFFYLEDGHQFPKIDAIPRKRSALHLVYLNQNRTRDGCIDYEYSDRSLRGQDDFIQDCVVRDRRNKDRIIPIGVNLKIEGNMSEYADFKFSNDSDLWKDSLEYCTGLHKKPECINVTTRLSADLLNEKRDNISVNLTPLVYEIKSLEDDSALVVLTRILSFLVIFTGFSVRKFSKAIISFYLFACRRQLKKLLFYLGLFVLFLIHFSFLFHQIIHYPMLVTGYDSYANEIQSYGVRLCYQTGADLEAPGYTIEKLNSETLNLTDVIEKIKIYDEKNQVIDLSIQNFTLEEAVYWFTCSTGSWIEADEMYSGDLKCFNFYFGSEKNDRLNFRSFKQGKVISITFSFRKFKNQLEKHLFIHFNKAWVYDFAWNKAYSPAEYVFKSSTYPISYQDDYWYLKNFALYLKDLVGWSTSISSTYSFLMNIKEEFKAEQFATTTLVPIYWDEETGLPILNRQFNYYMQFRALATKRNEYDFTRNTDIFTLKNSYYVQKALEEKENLTLTIRPNLYKFVEKSRNRYRILELFLHLFITISFWFRVDIISLPVSLKKAFPIFKFFTFYFLYYVVSFLVYLFELWFAFVRFLKVKNE